MKSRHAVLPFGLAGGLIAASSMGVAVFNRENYGVFAPWTTPARIHYCGRDFGVGTSVSGSPASLIALDTGHPKWQRITQTLWGTPIYAGIDHFKNQTVCTMVLFLAQGQNRYLRYGLEGGP